MKRLIISLKRSSEVLKDFKAAYLRAKNRKAGEPHYEISFDNYRNVREAIKRRRLKSFRKELAAGIEQADRGEFVDGEKAFQKIHKRSEKRRHKRAI